MKKRHSIHLICFMMIFSFLFMNVQAFADTTVGVTSISLSKTSDVLTIGKTDTLQASILPTNATNQNITWLSTNPDVAKVFNGVVMALSQGTAMIMAISGDGSKSATCVVIVKKPDSTLSLSKTSDVLSVGSTDTLTASVNPSQAVTWSSSAPNVVQVFNGVLMAQSIGTAIITATAADGSSSATCSVTVNGAPASVTLSKTTDILSVGGADKLIATVTPSLPSGVYLMWISSSPNIVDVSGGLITGKSAGSAVITVIASDGSFSATCNVTVTDTVNTTRLGGADRYETSVSISKYGWPNGSTYAVLATGNDYPDALSAAPLAKKYNAPILLTDTNSIPQSTLNEIERLKATHIFICGGTGVVSKNVESQLNSMGITTERLQGADRYGTSAAIANKLGVTSGGLMVANGYDWADALSASSIAAQMEIPVILTDKDSLPDSINSFIASKNFNKAYILGDVDLISSSVANKFQNPERITGSTEYERNINIIKRFQSSLDITNICAATGADFPDALSGSALAAAKSSAIVLVDNSGVQDVTAQYITQSLAQTQNVYVFGLQGAVSDDMINRLFTR